MADHNMDHNSFPHLYQNASGFHRAERSSSRDEMAHSNSMQWQPQIQQQANYANPFPQYMAQPEDQHFYDPPTRPTLSPYHHGPVPSLPNAYSYGPMSPARPQSQGVSSYGSSNHSGAPSPQEGNWEVDERFSNNFRQPDLFANHPWQLSQSQASGHVQPSQIQVRPDSVTLHQESPFNQDPSIFSLDRQYDSQYTSFQDSALGTSPEDAVSPRTSYNQYDELDAEGDADNDVESSDAPLDEEEEEEEEEEVEVDETEDADEYTPTSTRPRRQPSSRKRRPPVKFSNQPQNKKFRAGKARTAKSSTGKNVGKASSSKSTSASRSAKSDPALQCHKCPKKNFKDSTTLQHHLKLHANPPFICTFSFAGCPATFIAKNEWKRHVKTLHSKANTWVCTHGQCQDNVIHSFPNSPLEQERGKEFNRNDLLKNHMERMHFKDRVNDSTWKDEVKRLVTAAEKKKMEQPTKLCCPRANCGVIFQGENTMDDRLEHIGKHLEKGEMVTQSSDPFLIQWALNERIIEMVDNNGSFRLCAASKKGQKSRSTGSVASAMSAGSPASGSGSTMGYQDYEGDAADDDDAYGEDE